MAIVYEPLRKYMAQHNISYYYLGNQGIDNQTLHQLRHDQSITMKTLNKLCRILNCKPQDIIDYIPDDEDLHS